MCFFHWRVVYTYKWIMRVKLFSNLNYNPFRHPAFFTELEQHRTSVEHQVSAFLSTRINAQTDRIVKLNTRTKFLV